MNIDVYECDHYVDVIKEAVQQSSRGFKSHLARAMRCQPSYLSQVLSGGVELTLDQAYACARFLAFNRQETDVFLLIVQRDRAGTHELKSYFTDQIVQFRREQQVLSTRLGEKTEISAEDYNDYYSAWYHSAIHVATSIPSMQDSRIIAEKLNLDMDVVEASLRLLKKMNLVEQVGGAWKNSHNDLHVPDSSPLHVANHMNWRSFYCQSIQQQNEDTIHYTAVHSLSIKDLGKLKKLIFEFIENSRSIVGPSKEEKIVAVGLDFVPI